MVRAAAIALLLSSWEVAAVPRVPTRPDAMSIRIETRVVDEGVLRIVIVSQRAADGLIPFIKLRNVATGEEYWSAFDDRGVPLVVNGRVPIRRGTTEIALRLSGVKWARSRDALWPFRSFREVIPPGRYEVVATLSPRRHPSVESNRVSLTVDGGGRIRR